MVTGGGNTKKPLGHERGALLNGVSASIKETPGIHVWGHSEMTMCEPGREFSSETEFDKALTLDLQLPELWGIHLCCLEAT